ncbi:glycosyltransferase family 4 protein [Larkinella sp. VNQ87]|uniref:glycosyltransferase family 4 protein n=1 Tax=Larkinella sp. VNQ87 TaxID=3400921 RepID=UPI003C0BB3E7
MTLKILFISHKFYPDIGGIEANSEILANAFAKAGHEVRLLTWSMDSKEKKFPFAVIRKPDRRTLFREHARANLVFENNVSLRLAWPNLFFRRPSVIALHTWLSRPDGSMGWQDRLKFLWLQKARRVIAVSNSVRERCWPASLVIENPYQETIFQKYPEIIRSRDFVFLGRLVSDKGADIAIQAFHYLLVMRDQLPGLSPIPSLTIVGDGPEREFLETETARLGLSNHVLFTGSLRDKELVHCLNQHRFMLVPSRWEEPFGMVALEGMACGCIPIVSDGGGLPDAVGKAGLTFRRANVEDLVANIQKILGNPSLEQQLLDAAPYHLSTHRPDVVAHRYLETFKQAISDESSS